MITVQSTGFWRHIYQTTSHFLWKRPWVLGFSLAPLGKQAHLMHLRGHLWPQPACRMGRTARHVSSDCYARIVSPAGQSLIPFWAQLCTYSQGDGKALMVPWLTWPMSKTLFLRKRKKGTKVYTVQHFLQELWFKCPHMISFKNQRKSKASLHCALSSFFSQGSPHLLRLTRCCPYSSHWRTPADHLSHFLITYDRGKHTVQAYGGTPHVELRPEQNLQEYNAWRASNLSK